jgi:small subunit ribosomal protein S20
MANIRSQIKRNLQNEKRRVRNKQVRSELRTRVKVAEEGGENAEESLQVAMKTIDKAAAKGVIHKNEASHRKSRLMKKANAAS